MKFFSKSLSKKVDIKRILIISLTIFIGLLSNSKCVNISNTAAIRSLSKKDDMDVETMRFKALTINLSNQGSYMNLFDFKNIILNQSELVYYTSNSKNSQSADSNVNTKDYQYTELLSDISLPCKKKLLVCLYGELLQEYKPEFIEVKYELPIEVLRVFTVEEAKRKCIVIVTNFLDILARNTIICHSDVQFITNMQIEISKKIREYLFREGEASATYQGQKVKVIINSKKITVVNKETKQEMVSIETKKVSYASVVNSCPISRKEASAQKQRQSNTNSPDTSNAPANPIPPSTPSTSTNPKPNGENNKNYSNNQGGQGGQGMPRFKSVMSNFRKFRTNNNSRINNTPTPSAQSYGGAPPTDPKSNQNDNQPLQCTSQENEGCVVMVSKENESNKYVFCSEHQADSAGHKALWSSQATANQINPKIINIRYKKAIKEISKATEQSSISSEVMQPIADKCLIDYRSTIGDIQKRNNANPRRTSVDISSTKEAVKKQLISECCQGIQLCMNGLKYMIKNGLMNLNEKESSISMSVSNKYHEKIPQGTYKISGVSKGSIGGKLVNDASAISGQGENLFSEELNIQSGEFPGRKNVLEAVKILKNITGGNSKNYSNLADLKAECTSQNSKKTAKLSVLPFLSSSDMFMSYLGTTTK